MPSHIFIPGLSLLSVKLVPSHLLYLNEWHEEAVQKADNGDVSTSICLQGAFIELALSGHLTHDWMGILDEYLTDDESAPIAYSEKYGQRLYGFRDQAKQSTILSIHTRWWIENIQKGTPSVEHDKYAALLMPRKLMNGLIYDHDVSETIIRHRMKTELTMSLAYSLEIIGAADRLNDELKTQVIASLVDSKKCPPTGYMSTEYFRLQALRILDAVDHFPIGIEESIDACATDLEVGYCDFSMADKRDAYMGTVKRTARDKPIHSPLTACHVRALTEVISEDLTRDRINKRLDEYSRHMEKQPMDIPAFQMRDVPIPFGTDRTPIEVLCAAYHIRRNLET